MHIKISLLGLHIAFYVPAICTDVKILRLTQVSKGPRNDAVKPGPQMCSETNTQTHILSGGAARLMTEG